jgi:hypothetical protein
MAAVNIGWSVLGVDSLPGPDARSGASEGKVVIGSSGVIIEFRGGIPIVLCGSNGVGFVGIVILPLWILGAARGKGFTGGFAGFRSGGRRIGGA